MLFILSVFFLFQICPFPQIPKTATSPSKDPFAKATDSILNMRDLLQNVKQFHEEETKELVEDKEDYSVIRFGVCCTLRGKQGRVMTAIPSISNVVTTTKPSQPPGGGAVYLLGVDGQGVGEDSDTMMLVSTESKDSKDPIRYGDTLSIKCPASKDRSVTFSRRNLSPPLLCSDIWGRVTPPSLASGDLLLGKERSGSS
jgi:hypothetical protein